MVRAPWFWFLLFVLLVAVASSLRFVAVVALVLLLILVLASWWRNHSLDDVQYQRRFHYTRSFPGETTSVRVQIENRKWLPVSWLRARDTWHRAVGPRDETILGPGINDLGYLTNLVTLRWHERVRREYELLFRQRGVHPVGPVTLESGDVFGLYNHDVTLPLTQQLTVFPAPVPFEDLLLPNRNPFGDLATRRRLYEDPNRPIGVRAYHPEDGFRRVHWPATARTGELQVKVYQPVSAQVLMLCMNISTSLHVWEGIDRPRFEYLLSVAATLSMRGLERGYQVGIMANGGQANSDQPFRILPGRSPRQLEALLTALAGVTPLVMSPFDQFLLKETPRVPYGATLLVLTNVFTPALAEVLMRIKRHERQVTLLSFGADELPEIPGVRAIHRPFGEGLT